MRTAMNATKTALALVATLSALLLTACAADVSETNATVSEQELTLPENAADESASASSGKSATFQDVFGTTTGVVAPQDPIDHEPHPFPWKKVETSLQRPPRVQPADPSTDHASAESGSGSTGSTSDDNTTPKP